VEGPLQVLQRPFRKASRARTRIVVEAKNAFAAFAMITEMGGGCNGGG